MVFLFVILVCCCCWIRKSHSKTFTISEQDGSNENRFHTVSIDPGDSLYNKTKHLCASFKQPLLPLDCDKLAVKFSRELYGHHYVSSCPSCGEAEFLSSRWTVLSYLMDRFQYKSYLEIGTFDDEIFSAMRKQVEIAIGVDPWKGGTHRMTSDVFFSSNVQMFDLIFVDGLHEADQAFRDIQNSLKFLNDNGTIVIHDCNPFGDELISQVPRHPNAFNWAGDTWKAAVAMRMAVDVEILVVDIDFGVGVLRRRTNRHPLSVAWQRRLSVNPVSMLRFTDYLAHRQDLLRLTSLSDFVLWLDEEK